MLTILPVERRASPPGWTGETSLCRNPEGCEKVDRAISSSREAATQESPARQCRLDKMEQS